MVRQVIDGGEDPHAEVDQRTRDEIFILWLKGADQQVAVTVEDGAILALGGARDSGAQVEDQFGHLRL